MNAHKGKDETDRIPSSVNSSLLRKGLESMYAHILFIVTLCSLLVNTSPGVIVLKLVARTDGTTIMDSVPIECKTPSSNFQNLIEI
ncbi:hypothetical protein M422DRAFT_777055 [Sphaerobolus stellatus SS14]|nr:hypothetical protein M422DRAFT_777055 [Sphaerobolus stellatus SS14]